MVNGHVDITSIASYLVCDSSSLSFVDALSITGAPCPGSKVLNSNPAILLTEAKASSILSDILSDSFILPPYPFLQHHQRIEYRQFYKDKCFLLYGPEMNYLEAVYLISVFENHIRFNWMELHKFRH